MLRTEREITVSREIWKIAAAGLTPRLLIAARKLCATHGSFRFTERMVFASLRLDEVCRAAPDIVLVDEDCAGTHPLAEFRLLHEALPNARALVVGASTSPSELLERLRVGVWGVLSRARAASEIEPALQAVARNELWLSRRELCGLLMLALSGAQPSVQMPHADLPQLTLRENAVMQRVIEGYSNKEIARTLGITEHTVKVHLHHVYGKLHLRRVDLLLAYRNGLGAMGPTIDGAKLPA